MTIIVTGSTGTVGSQVVAQLANRGAPVRALVRDPSKARFPEEVEVVSGEMLDVDSLRAAFAGGSTLFLLNAVVPDELTQALITLNVAREAGVRNVVYLSVIHADLYTNVPHFTGKHSVERMIESAGLAATVLRPAYFMNNDIRLKDVITGHGVYPMPIGEKGVGMVDVRDIAEVAALELIRLHGSGSASFDVLDLAGPDILTGSSIAALWSEILGKGVAYGGDDTGAFEANLKQFAPAWMAYDMRLMLDRIQTIGMIPAQGSLQRLEAMLGRPLRSYSAFAKELATQPAG